MQKRPGQKQQNQIQEDKQDPLEAMEHRGGQKKPQQRPQKSVQDDKPDPLEAMEQGGQKKPRQRSEESVQGDEQDPLEPMEHQSGQSRPGSRQSGEQERSQTYGPARNPDKR
ncbi:MAG TPA: hypothetical protein VFH21_02030 [Burkholderiales bacterium]|nr:hypothetical protein [Burkholderiales bacterium]